MSETVLLMRPVLVVDRSVRPSSPPLRGRPHRLTAGRGAAAPGPASAVSGNVSHCRGHVRGKTQQSFYKCMQKCIISFPPTNTKPGTWKGGISHCARIFRLRCHTDTMTRNSSESGQIGRAVDSRRGAGPGWRQGQLCVRQWG